MGATATDGPAGFSIVRTYRLQGSALTRGFGVVQGTADDQATVPLAAAARCLGVVAEGVDSTDDPAGIVTFGECVAVAGAVVHAGDVVKMDINGKFIAANAEDVETAGKARTSAAADTDEFILFVDPNHKRSA